MPNFEREREREFMRVGTCITGSNETKQVKTNKTLLDLESKRHGCKHPLPRHTHTHTHTHTHCKHPRPPHQVWVGGRKKVLFDAFVDLVPHRCSQETASSHRHKCSSMRFRNLSYTPHPSPPPPPTHPTRICSPSRLQKHQRASASLGRWTVCMYTRAHTHINTYTYI